MPLSLLPKPVASPPPEIALREKFADPFGDRAHKALYKYLLGVNDWHGYIKFLGLPALRDTSRDVPLRNLFVQPRLSTGHLASEAFADPDNIPATVPLSDAFLAHPRLVILGDPGSGKSTLVNWLCDVFSFSEPHPLREKLGPLVPLPLIIRELGIDAGITWEGLLAAFHARPVGAALDLSTLASLLDTGQAFLLLDGIDEIGSVEVREALREAVWEGMRKHPRCRWMLTSRVVGYDEVNFDSSPCRVGVEVERLSKHGQIFEYEVRAEDGRKRRISSDEPSPNFLEKAMTLFPTAGGWAGEWRGNDKKQSGFVDTFTDVATRLHVAPFDDPQIEQFVRLWWTQHETTQALVRQRCAEFLDALRAHPDTLTLARIPNLLTLVALIYRVFAFLPDGRAILYAKIAEAYLETIDEFRKLPRPVPFSRRQKEAWLARVGWEMQLRRDEAFAALKGLKRNKDEDGDGSPREILAGRGAVLGWLREEMRRQIGPDAEAAAPLFLEYAGKRSGLLLPRGEDRYAFLHLSFQEYFAAFWLCDAIASPRWWRDPEKAAPPLASLQRWAGEAHWREVFILLFELLGERSADYPASLLRLLLGLDPGGADWPPLRTPFPKAKSKAKPAHSAPGTVELLAILASDPHVQVEHGTRSEWVRLCWDWEVQRQNADGERPRENPVARLLLGSGGSAGTSLRCLLEEVPVVKEAALLSLAGCTGLTALPSLDKLASLKWLSLDGCTGLTALPALDTLASLQILDLPGCTGLTALPALDTLASLEWLELSGCTGLIVLPPLDKLASLRLLSLAGCTGLTALPALDKLTSLQYLHLNGCTGLGTTEVAEQVAKLQAARRAGGRKEIHVSGP
jgi:internalin A